MANPHIRQFTQIAEKIRDGYRDSNLSITEFAKLAGCSTRTTYIWTKPERLEIPDDLSDRRKCRGISSSIIRLLHTIGEKDISGWLEKVGLEDYVDDVGKVTSEIDGRVVVNVYKQASEMTLKLPITNDDWEFIGRMRKEFDENMTIEFLIELLRRRKVTRD